VGEGDPGSPVSRTCAHQGEPGGVESRAGTRGSSGWWSQITRVRIAFSRAIERQDSPALNIEGKGVAKGNTPE
jgi:hypothetical protein